MNVRLPWPRPVIALLLAIALPASAGAIPRVIKGFHEQGIVRQLDWTGFSTLAKQDQLPPEIKRKDLDPGIDEQFEITRFKRLPKVYYDPMPKEDEPVKQPYRDHGPTLLGGTGTIDMPTAYTLKKGTWVGGLTYDSRNVDLAYWSLVYTEQDTKDIYTTVNYGLRDDVELSLTMSYLDRDMVYSNSSEWVTSGRVLFGIGAKFSYGSSDYTWALGFHNVFYQNRDRPIIDIQEYERLTALYASMTREEGRFTGNLMFKYANYDLEGGRWATAPFTGGTPPGGYLPERDWVIFGVGLEYRPRDRWFVMAEYLKESEGDFAGIKGDRLNMGLRYVVSRTDLKLFSRNLNFGGFDEIGFSAAMKF